MNTGEELENCVLGRDTTGSYHRPQRALEPASTPRPPLELYLSAMFMHESRSTESNSLKHAHAYVALCGAVHMCTALGLSTVQYPGVVCWHLAKWLKSFKDKDMPKAWA